MKKMIALMALALMFNTTAVFSQSDDLNYNNSQLIQIDIQSKRIPQGKIIKIRMGSPVNTQNSSKGDPFFATITEDIKVDNSIILPANSAIRGRVGYIKKNSYLSRGGELILNFDHIITPVGRQVPVASKISNCKNLTPTGSIATGGGYLNAVVKNLNQGVEILTNTTNYGIKKGLSWGNGMPVILTAPIAAAGGVAAGGTVFFVKSAMAIVKKGDNVKINPGDILEIKLVEALDIPSN